MKSVSDDDNIKEVDCVVILSESNKQQAKPNNRILYVVATVVCPVPCVCLNEESEIELKKKTYPINVVVVRSVECQHDANDQHRHFDNAVQNAVKLWKILTTRAC